MRQHEIPWHSPGKGRDSIRIFAAVVKACLNSCSTVYVSQLRKPSSCLAPVRRQETVFILVTTQLHFHTRSCLDKTGSVQLCHCKTISSQLQLVHLKLEEETEPDPRTSSNTNEAFNRGTRSLVWKVMFGSGQGPFFSLETWDVRHKEGTSYIWCVGLLQAPLEVNAASSGVS